MDKPTISQPPANLPLRSSPSTFADNREDYLTWEQASGFPSIQDAVDYVEFGIGQVESDIAETAANANAAEAAQALAEAARVASLADLFADTTAFLASGDADGIVPEAGGYRHYSNVSGVAVAQEWVQLAVWDTPANLFASTITGFDVGMIVAAGGNRYEVLDPSATEYDASNAGGEKFKLLKNADGSYTFEACDGVNPTDATIVHVTEDYATAPALAERSNVIFVGDGSFAGTNEDTTTYRRQVIPPHAPSAQAFPDVIAGDLGLMEDAKIVVVGDSLTSYGANSISASDVLAERLESQLKMDNRGKNITVISRGVGSTTYDELDGVPTVSFDLTARYSWYTDPARAWLEYVEDETPDIVVLSFGMNDHADFDETAFASVITKLEAFANPPQIIFCTNMVPNLSPPVGGESFATFASQEGRDFVAGYVRTYAAFHGYTCFDINRTFNLVRDGRDILDCYLVEQDEVTFVSASEYAASSDQYCRDFSIRTEIETAAYTNTDELAVKTGPDSNNIVLIDDNGGFLRFKYYGGGSGSLFETATSTIPTPTTDVTWEFSVKSAPGGSTFSARIIPDGSGEDAGVDPFTQVIIRHGGVFAPEVKYFGGGGTGPCLSATLYMGVEKAYMPSATDVEIWGDDLSGEGNGRNHPTSEGAALIYGAHFSAQNYSLPWSVEEVIPVGQTFTGIHTGSGSVGFGGIVTGDNLRPANALGEMPSSQPSHLNANRSFKCMGYVNGTTDQERTTTWRRIK